MYIDPYITTIEQILISKFLLKKTTNNKRQPTIRFHSGFDILYKTLGIARLSLLITFSIKTYSDKKNVFLYTPKMSVKTNRPFEY